MPQRNRLSMPEGVRSSLLHGLLVRVYVRRFDLEHTFRFLKQSMGWTTPRVRHPESRRIGGRG